MLLLDDLQELFDPPNRRRVANAMPHIAGSGGRVVATTNDRLFRKQAVTAFREGNRARDVDHRRLHAPSAARPHIELGVFLETVELKQREFKRPENENKAEPARDYIKEVRIYIENRLLDFIDEPGPALPGKPTLSDLLGAIRSLRNNGHEPFDGAPFANLVSDHALAQGSEVLRLMNLSHHGRADEISYADVAREAEACDRVCRLVDGAYSAYKDHLRRDPPERAECRPEMPEPLLLPEREVPVIERLAAFADDTAPAEIIETDDVFSVHSLVNHAIYYIRTHNLGFAGPPGCRVLVKLSEEPPPDNCLVVALHEDRCHVGRLHRDADRPGIVVIGSEAENPMQRPPSRFLPAEEVRLLEVAGVLFDETPCYARSSDDATLVEECDVLDKIEVVFRVDRDSALPLTIEGQTILAGARVPSAQLSSMEGALVAVATSEGCALKRVGNGVPGAAHVRRFESVGGLGESMLVRIEDVDDDFRGLPLLHSARRVLGVIYEPR